jgi:hypothetical protein
METKSYLIEEHETTLFDNEEINQWKELVDKLNLPEQRNLIAENKSPLPFPAMSKAEKDIYTVVLDTHQDYKLFGREAIPLQGLSLIALCEAEKYFDKIEIWYSEQRKDDPLIIGKKYDSESDRVKQYYWNMSNFIIFAWGPKLKPFTSLLPLYEQYRKKQIESTYENNLKNLKDEVELFRFQINSFEPIKGK